MNDPEIRSILLFLLALFLAIALAAGLAIVFFGKRRRRRREHYAYPSFDEPAADEPSGHQSHRRRRRAHRPRNPTRAETGGLPPRNDLDPDPVP